MLARRIEEALATIAAADDAPVRASIGVAVYPRDGETPDDLLERADLELRETKQRRRAATLLADDVAEAGTVAAWATTPSTSQV